MLDSTTRSKIDALRDTLVGKLPVPSEQVKQITLGLMYKFMGDLDEEYSKLDSKPFFGGKYERYAWRNIMALTEAPKRAELYVEGIEKMSLNPGIPQLFRDIFKGAFFPFRDPRIIGEFLKGIDEFKYEHSEDLGDAFEYLLQVSGEQGKAGQLRTPRHIIDFIVECVDPQKTDRILDPACGTAGFLVSAYKHILCENTRPGSDRPGSALTTNERNALRGNFTGYDISHDMVRISLVNMYLHLFPNPRIYEYDTLTSQERWDEDADCILANPPFMTPKGGIRPHSRFQIKASRSEILFVDYMLEHLSPQGKMGVIVPEGIIFQSNTAYKALRKLLVDGGYLYAVVSLPGGVFNPYSGVKTSILLIDRVLAKKAQDILFVKVENDGFDLGAQRRDVDKNDLPQMLKVVRAYKDAIAEGKDPRKAVQRLLHDVKLSEAKHLGVVPKAQISENGDYALSAERYRAAINAANLKWPLARLGEVAEVIAGQSPEGKYYNEEGQGLPFYQGKVDFGEVYLQSPRVWTTQVTKEALNNDVLMSVRAPVGPVNLAPFRICIGRGLAAVRVGNELNYLYLFYILRGGEERLKRLATGSTFEAINRQSIEGLKIPLPPLSVQQEIVAELDGYQKVIDGARQVVENYKPQIAAEPDWPMVELGKACETIMDGTHFSPPNAESGERLYITSKNVRENRLDLTHVSYISEKEHRAIYSRCSVRQGDVLYVKDGANTGLAALNTLSEEFSLLSSVAVMRGKPEMLDNHYLVLYLNSGRGRQYMLSMIDGVAITRLTLTKLNAALIPIPPLARQKAIVARIEEEQKLVQANRRLIELFEAKIRDRIKEVWGDGMAGAE